MHLQVIQAIQPTNQASKQVDDSWLENCPYTVVSPNIRGPKTKMAVLISSHHAPGMPRRFWRVMVGLGHLGHHIYATAVVSIICRRNCCVVTGSVLFGHQTFNHSAWVSSGDGELVSCVHVFSFRLRVQWLVGFCHSGTAGSPWVFVRYVACFICWWPEWFHSRFSRAQWTAIMVSYTILREPALYLHRHDCIIGLGTYPCVRELVGQDETTLDLVALRCIW